MDPLWSTALWQQFGATIDIQENAARLNLFLGQNAIDGASDWVSYSSEPSPEYPQQKELTRLDLLFSTDT